MKKTPQLPDGTLSPKTFDTLARQYRRETKLPLALITPDGRRILGESPCPDNPAHRALHQQSLAETLRWGEPAIMTCPCGHALWTHPVMRNQQTLAGLLVSGVPLENDDTDNPLDRRLLAATQTLQKLAEHHNLANTAQLRQNRHAAERESGRAETLHDLKERLYDEIRSIYLHEEPALLAAIQRGERTEARGIINRILTAIYARGAGRRNLLKTLSLELVVMMARAAVQAGAEPEKILGLNYRSLTELADIHSHEDLSRWLCEMLEQLIDAMGAPAAHPNAVQLARAIAHIEQHFAEPLTRDEVARAAGLSPSHFSHLMREHADATFTEILLRIRLENARRLLTRTSQTIAEIAQNTGFTDQSYFTRVFKKTFRQTPNDYRRHHALRS